MGMYVISTELLEDLAFETGGEAYADYSGRGMYGDECVGLVFNHVTDFLNLGASIKQAYDDKRITRDVYEEFTTGASTDNMGHGVVIYWQNIATEPEA